MAVKTTEIDGSKIRYLEEGTSKNTLVLLHGLGASAERWEDVIPLFAKKFRVIVPDLIGFGYSDKPAIDYTTDYFAEFMSKFVEKVGIKEMSIIGSSLGGQIAAEFIINQNVDVKKTRSCFTIRRYEAFNSCTKCLHFSCIISKHRLGLECVPSHVWE